MRIQLRNARIAALFTAVLGLSAAGTAFAAAPAQAATLCTFEVLSLEAQELQDGDGNDEIKFTLGDDLYGPFDFGPGRLRTTSLGQPQENYQVAVTFTLHEQDLTRQTIDSVAFGCVASSGIVRLTGRGAIYDLGYQITT